MHGTKAATNARFAIEALTLEWPAMLQMDTYIVQVNILEAIRFLNQDIIISYIYKGIIILISHAFFQDVIAKTLDLRVTDLVKGALL